MRKKIIALAALFSFQIAAAAAEESAPTVSPLKWPRQVTLPQGTLVVYQPQLESFEGDKLTGRAAVAAVKKGSDTPIFGAVWLSARADIDREKRTVKLLEVKVSKAKFPDVPEERIKAASLLLEKAIMEWDLTLSLDQLLTALELVKKKHDSDENLKTDPPRIFFSSEPALLVVIDGEPKLEKTADGSLMRVANTPFFVVFQPESKKYFFKGEDEWFETSELKGDWKVVGQVPEAVKKLASAEFEGEKPEAAPEKKSETLKPPKVIVSTEPAELIVSEGKPEFATIGETKLRYMTNTESDVFLDSSSGRYYVLISGRWNAAESLDSDSWVYVDPKDLPPDFKKIPSDSPKAAVLASVPGTVEANEAVLDTYIPETTKIDVSEAEPIQVEYDGEPEFKPIESTDLAYAENTDYAVIRCSGKYYCCHRGVWYAAGGPNGPWTICGNVPTPIYSIPPSCPIYHVRYVYVFYRTPRYVYVGYYPGYVGCYAYRGVVVYGTGWRYRPWYRRRYYARPVTYGFRARYNPYAGRWSFAVGARRGGVGLIAARSVHRGWWGPAGYRSRYAHTMSARKTARAGGVSTAARVAYRDSIYKRRARSVRPGTGGTRTPRAEAQKVKAQVRPGTAVKGAAAVLNLRQNNVFADRQGNIYRKTQKGWQRKTSSGWTPVKSASNRSSWTPTKAKKTRPVTPRPKVRPSPAKPKVTRTARTIPHTTRTQLERTYKARVRASERARSYRARSTPRRSAPRRAPTRSRPVRRSAPRAPRGGVRRR